MLQLFYFILQCAGYQNATSMSLITIDRTLVTQEQVLLIILLLFVYFQNTDSVFNVDEDSENAVETGSKSR